MGLNPIYAVALQKKIRITIRTKKSWSLDNPWYQRHRGDAAGEGRRTSARRAIGRLSFGNRKTRHRRPTDASDWRKQHVSYSWTATRLRSPRTVPVLDVGRRASFAISGMEMWVEDLTWRETCPRPTPSTHIRHAERL